MPSNSTALVVDAPATNAASNSAPLSLHDIRGPVEIPDYWLYLWIALGVIAAVVLGYFAWKYWLKERFGPKPLPPVPAHVRAKRKLREALAHINDPQVFTVFVSDTIRVYLEERFNFHAPERTTEEFLYELQSTNLLTKEHKESLGAFLTRCDLIKFAKYDPTRPELEELHQAAMSLVEDTEPKPVAAQAGALNPQSAIRNPQSS